MPQQVIIEDNEFLRMITKGYTSAYAIHRVMKKEAEVNEKLKVISYKNIAERMLRLVKDGLIEETEEIDGKRSIHGRKDYKLTNKGALSLIPHIMTHPEDVKNISEYIVRFNLDKQAFENILVSNVVTSMESEIEYLTSMWRLGLVAPTNPNQLKFMQEATIGFHNKLMETQKAVFAKQLERVTEIKTGDGIPRRIRSEYRPERSDPYYEQVQQKMEQGKPIMVIPEEEDSETKEEKRIGHRTQYIPKPVQSNRSKNTATLKKKR